MAEATRHSRILVTYYLEGAWPTIAVSNLQSDGAVRFGENVTRGRLSVPAVHIVTPNPNPDLQDWLGPAAGIYVTWHR